MLLSSLQGNLLARHTSSESQIVHKTASCVMVDILFEDDDSWHCPLLLNSRQLRTRLQPLLLRKISQSRRIEPCSNVLPVLSLMWCSKTTIVPCQMPASSNWRKLSEDESKCPPTSFRGQDKPILLEGPRRRERLSLVLLDDNSLMPARVTSGPQHTIEEPAQVP